MRIVREIRCFPEGPSDQEEGSSSWGGRPAFDGFEVFWTVRAAVEGALDRRTGFLCDIKQIDTLLRTVAVPALVVSGRTAGQSRPSLALTLRTVFASVGREWCGGGTLALLQVAVSPFLCYAVEADRPDMVQITQSFEFSAAHRLACRDLSDEENRRLFGKCSNPHGHGHNYVLEVTVGGEPDPKTGLIIGLQEMQQVVHDCVIHPFDHKNLNVEVADFRTVNPSVENITRVIWTRLKNVFAPCRLLKVRVWETPKTYAEYCGDG